MTRSAIGVELPRYDGHLSLWADQGGASWREAEEAAGLVHEGERLDPQRGYAFMKAYRATFPLAAMCRVLGLSPSDGMDAPSRRHRNVPRRCWVIATVQGLTI